MYPHKKHYVRIGSNCIDEESLFGQLELEFVKTMGCVLPLELQEQKEDVRERLV